MTYIRYEPFNLLDRLHREVSRLGAYDSLANELADDDSSNIVVSHWRPAVDIKEEDKQFVIRTDIPGVDPKDIEITMEAGILSIKGERTVEEEDESGGYKRIERTHGTFYRRFSLPDTADAERIEARGKDGVLEIVLPQHEKVQPRRITVNS